VTLPAPLRRRGQHGVVQFDSEQPYRHDVEDVVDAYADPALYPGLPDLPKIGRPEVLDHRRDGDLVHLDLRYAYTGDLPAAATAIIDPARLTWVQRTTVELRRQVSTVRLLPDHYPDRLSCAGTYEFAAEGGRTGCRRRVRGELKVRVPVVGRQVERALVSGLEEFLAAESGAVDRWIDGLT
jgi:hypothetical protein